MWKDGAAEKKNTAETQQVPWCFFVSISLYFKRNPFQECFMEGTGGIYIHPPGSISDQ
jgi:hypothetical protein